MHVIKQHLFSSFTRKLNFKEKMWGLKEQHFSNVVNVIEWMNTYKMYLKEMYTINKIRQYSYLTVVVGNKNWSSGNNYHKDVPIHLSNTNKKKRAKHLLYVHITFCILHVTVTYNIITHNAKYHHRRLLNL